MDEQVTHEKFVEMVANHLKEREGCPTLIIVHTPHGMEMQTNFKDYAMHMGILDIAKMTVAIAFNRQSREALASGENQIMASNIADACNPDKKKVN